MKKVRKRKKEKRVMLVLKVKTYRANSVDSDEAVHKHIGYIDNQRDREQQTLQKSISSHRE